MFESYGKISSVGCNGAITRGFGAAHWGRLLFLFERHEGPCDCSFCDKSGRQLKTLPAFGAKIDGVGWNMIWWPTPWTRWYLRWCLRNT
jgi:hypothetical protein